jgi:hypothetical protein
MTVHVRTRVLPGNKVEVTANGLREGQDVEVTIRPLTKNERAGGQGGILDFIDSLPPSRKTPEEWAQFEREFQEERDSWDR